VQGLLRGLSLPRALQSPLPKPDLPRWDRSRQAPALLPSAAPRTQAGGPPGRTPGSSSRGQAGIHSPDPAAAAAAGQGAGPRVEPRAAHRRGLPSQLGLQHPNPTHGAQQQPLQPNHRGQAGSGAQPGAGTRRSTRPPGCARPGGAYNRPGERGTRSSRGRGGHEVQGRGSAGPARGPSAPRWGPCRSPCLGPSPWATPLPLRLPLGGSGAFSPAGTPLTPLFGPILAAGDPLAGMGAAPPYMLPVSMGVGMGMGMGVGMGMGMGVGPIAGYPTFPMPAPQLLANDSSTSPGGAGVCGGGAPAARDPAECAARSAVPAGGGEGPVGAQADVEVFGSYATGLALPYSDVDVAVVRAPLPLRTPLEVRSLSGARISAPLIRQLAKALQKQPWCESLYTIETGAHPSHQAAVQRGRRPAAANRQPWGGGPGGGQGGGGRGLPEPLARSLSPAPVPSTGMIGPARRETVKMDVTIAMSRPPGMPLGDEASKQLAAKLDAAAAAHNGAAAREFVMSRLKQYPALAPSGENSLQACPLSRVRCCCWILLPGVSAMSPA